MVLIVNRIDVWFDEDQIIYIFLLLEVYICKLLNCLKYLVKIMFIYFMLLCVELYVFEFVNFMMIMVEQMYI